MVQYPFTRPAGLVGDMEPLTLSRNSPARPHPVAHKASLADVLGLLLVLTTRLSTRCMMRCIEVMCVEEAKTPACMHT